MIGQTAAYSFNLHIPKPVRVQNHARRLRAGQIAVISNLRVPFKIGADLCLRVKCEQNRRNQQIIACVITPPHLMYLRICFSLFYDRIVPFSILLPLR